MRACLQFINYLLGCDFPGQRVGPEPTTDRFVAVGDLAPTTPLPPPSALFWRGCRWLPFLVLRLFGGPPHDFNLAPAGACVGGGGVRGLLSCFPESHEPLPLPPRRLAFCPSFLAPLGRCSEATRAASFPVRLSTTHEHTHMNTPT